MHITIIVAVLREIASPSCHFAGGSSHFLAAIVADGSIAFDLIFLGKHDFLGKDDFLGKYRGRTPLFAWFDPLREASRGRAAAKQGERGRRGCTDGG